MEVKLIAIIYVNKYVTNHYISVYYLLVNDRYSTSTIRKISVCLLLMIYRHTTKIQYK